MATEEATTGNGEWQQVRRRRHFTTNWRHSQPLQPKNNLYQPYSRPTYAQILRQPAPPVSTMNHSRPTPPSSPPNSPISHTDTAIYVSPHSPTRLRFPPSHTFAEWKGRCFRCCRTGHSAAKCRNHKRCGRCWAFGHIGSKCKQEMVAPPPPVRRNPKPTVTRRGEPGFEELLTGSYSNQVPEMPVERPLRLHCFIERDEEYYTELQRLKQGVVMHTRGFQGDLSVDNVVDYACRTKIVKREEIQISQLSGSRFLIILPEGLDPDTFINATPQEVWDEGLSFQPWSPLEGAEISVPAYKILLRLVGVPPHLCREKHIRNVVCRFGVYLGSVPPENPASIASWIVAAAVDDLTLVPTQLAMHDGGLVHPILVYPLSYKRGPIYSVDEMPKHPKTYLRPQPPPPSSSSSDDEIGHNNSELVTMRTTVLRNLCRGRKADSLPPELRRFATLEELDMEYPVVATQETVTQDHHGQNQNIPQSVQSESQRHNSNLEIPQGATIVSNPKPARIAPPSNLPQQIPKRIQPQKILQKTYHLENKMQPIRIRSDSGTLAQNQSRVSASIIANPKKAPGTNQGNICNNSKTDSTAVQEQTTEGHESRRDPPEFIFRAKGTGPAGAKKSGPYNPKYKWTRPIPANNAQNTKKVMVTASNKRKSQQAPLSRPNKKSTNKGKEKEAAEVSFNSEGFYEVRVDYEHVSKLASGCGFKNKEVEEVIQADNAQRQAQAQNQASSSATGTEDVDLDLARFELDSDDELSSDEEGC